MPTISLRLCGCLYLYACVYGLVYLCVYACLSSYEGSVIGGISLGTPIDTSCSPLASQSDGIEDTRYASVNIIKKYGAGKAALAKR